MTTQLESDYASSYERLSPVRQKQVLEYAYWLRENEAELPERLRARYPCSGALQPLPTRLDDALADIVQGLSCTKRSLIEEYVLSLAEGRGTPGYVFRQFAGTIPEESLRRMEQAIKDECERIDYAGW